MPGITITRAEKKDLSQITPFIEQEFSYFTRTKKQFEDAMNNKQVVVFKATRENAFLGFIEIQKLANREARINGLGVNKEYRGKGMGQLLVNEALDFLEGENIERVKLLVKSSNDNAKSVYEKCGFEFSKNHPRKIDGERVEELHCFLASGPRDAS